jgi:hypothetical protein
MNSTVIFASLLALLTGLAGGITYTKSNNEDSPQLTEERAKETVVAEDYVSIRPALASLPAESLSEVEKTDLIYMREEEKLARDVYQTLYENWGVQVFANIAQSEQTHTETVRDLLEKYDVTDPVTDDSVGVFQNEELQQLYNDLVSRGSASEVEAFKVGALIEELDIKDLQEAIDRTDNADIAFAYENLMRASRNHLRSFTKQLTARGETYTPQYISAEEYVGITATDTECVSKNGGGNGQRRGWGGM